MVKFGLTMLKYTSHSTKPMNFKTIASVALKAPALVACGAADNTSFKLNGTGATFPAPSYNSWLQDFAKETGNQVNYQTVGSGSGVRQFTAKTIDFGASDGAVSDAKQKLPMVHVPMTGGAIVPAYNYPGCDAKMTQTQLADVFLGKITNWSEFGCDDKNIVAVCCSDGSSTTKGFTNSLSAFSPEWKEKVGTGSSSSMRLLVLVVKVTLVLLPLSRTNQVLSVI